MLREIQCECEPDYPCHTVFCSLWELHKEYGEEFEDFFPWTFDNREIESKLWCILHEYGDMALETMQQFVECLKEEEEQG